MKVEDIDSIVLNGLKSKPLLDPEFIPAVCWNREYRKLADANKKSQKFIISVENTVGNVYSYETKLLPHIQKYKKINIRYVERLVKFLLWMKGGSRVFMTGNKNLFNEIKKIYSNEGERAFDNDFIGRTTFDMDLKFYLTTADNIPTTYDGLIKLGGHMDGTRLGLDIGGTNKKYAIVVDGEFKEADGIPWNPREQNDPQWFVKEIGELVDIAEKKVGNIDAVGVSSAGVFVNNHVKGGAIFSGVPKEKMKKLSSVFIDIGVEKNIPLDIANDGEVTALAGALSLKENSLLGVAMGTGLGAGYVTEEGTLTDRLNELGYVPFDYRKDGIMNTWSEDVGLTEDYLSIKIFPYLAKKAGINLINLPQSEVSMMCNGLAMSCVRIFIQTKPPIIIHMN